MTGWHTRINGNTYRLTDTGQLQPAQRKDPMSTAHLERMTTDRHREALRAVHDELLQLAIRRMEHRTEEQPR